MKMLNVVGGRLTSVSRVRLFVLMYRETIMYTTLILGLACNFGALYLSYRGR